MTIPGIKEIRSELMLMEKVHKKEPFLVAEKIWEKHKKWFFSFSFQHLLLPEQLSTSKEVGAISPEAQEMQVDLEDSQEVPGNNKKTYGPECNCTLLPSSHISLGRNKS